MMMMMRERESVCLCVCVCGGEVDMWVGDPNAWRGPHWNCDCMPNRLSLWAPAPPGLIPYPIGTFIIWDFYISVPHILKN